MPSTRDVRAAMAALVVGTALAACGGSPSTPPDGSSAGGMSSPLPTAAATAAPATPPSAAGMPAAAVTAPPSAAVVCPPDDNSPRPVDWSRVLPEVPLSDRWTVEPAGTDLLSVADGGEHAGVITASYYSACAWPATDFTNPDVALELARREQASLVADRAVGSPDTEVLLEPVRRVDVGGRPGAWSASSERIGGREIGRYIHVFAWDDVGLWVVTAQWILPADVSGPAFVDAATLRAFEPYLEDLLGAWHFPSALPTREQGA